MGSKVIFRGVAAEDACGVLGAAVAGSSVVVLGKTMLGSSTVVLGGAVAEPDGALTGCSASARRGAGAAGSSVELHGSLRVAPDLCWVELWWTPQQWCMALRK